MLTNVKKMHHLLNIRTLYALLLSPQVRYQHESLLLHPAVLALIRHKWRVANVLYLLFLLFYICFLVLVTSYMVTLKPPFQL